MRETAELGQLTTAEQAGGLKAALPFTVTRNRHRLKLSRYYHSSRNAAIGLTRDARRAGRNAASVATRTRPRAALMKVGVSIAFSPYNWLWTYLAKPQRAAEAERQADGDEHAGLAQDAARDVGRQGAERHADADFTRPARHRVGHHAVEADHRKSRRQQAEHGRQAGNQPVVRHGLSDLRLECVQVEDRQVRIERGDLPADSVRSSRRDRWSSAGRTSHGRSRWTRSTGRRPAAWVPRGPGCISTFARRRRSRWASRFRDPPRNRCDGRWD